jgi:thiol-disulfide isomerase/thioredoxin
MPTMRSELEVETTPSTEEIDVYLTLQAQATPIPTTTRDLILEQTQTSVAENPEWVHMVATDPSTFELASGQYQLVEKMAFWCEECRLLNPVLKNLEAEWGDKIRFVYLDVDDPLNTANLERLSRFRVVPELILLDGNGTVIKDWVGPPPRENLVAEFEKLP